MRDLLLSREIGIGHQFRVLVPLVDSGKKFSNVGDSLTWIPLPDDFPERLVASDNFSAGEPFQNHWSQWNFTLKLSSCWRKKEFFKFKFQSFRSFFNWHCEKQEHKLDLTAVNVELRSQTLFKTVPHLSFILVPEQQLFFNKLIPSPLIVEEMLYKLHLSFKALLDGCAQFFKALEHSDKGYLLRVSDLLGIVPQDLWVKDIISAELEGRTFGLVILTVTIEQDQSILDVSPLEIQSRVYQKL